MSSEFLSDLDVFETIEGSELPHDYLCPNLKTLVFNIDDEASIHIPLFLSPKVVHVDIHLPYNWPTPSLPDLPLRYPELRTLHLDHHSWWDGCRSTISKVVLTLHRIEDLALPGVDRAALEHISQLPALRLLTLEALVWEDLGPSPRLYSMIDAETPRFSALREIYLVHTTMDLVIELLELLSSCRLASFHVGTGDPVTRAITTQLYAALETHLTHSTLQTLRIGLPENEVDDALGDVLTNYTIDGSIVVPLLRFANLTTIYLSPPVGFDLDDTMTLAIARAWPKVRELSLTASTHTRCPSSISLLGLKAFAEHCHELTSLTITFDASTVPPFDDSLKTIASQSSLTFLGVEMSSINDPRAVASFLSPCFPKLANIKTYDYWLWDELNRMGDTYTGDDPAYIRCIRWMEVEWRVRSKRFSEEFDSDAWDSCASDSDMSEVILGSDS
ncbi:hypothetical protein MSAN_00214300 [Mycena sanguinolenta]|uniref:Uncharacterized protein n=1 Tax=Mycena sanguinolenta TaxID=230812 RepID=A0A8H7DNR5_9AGAR|nr:hypothetical protein MSAN_00214300 [Mycena sanguinolenta]